MKNIGGNAVIIKEINVNLVKEVLKNREKATKQEIAKETELSFVTVGSALQLLLEKKEIFETKLVQSNGGRPAQQYSYNFNYSLALIIYIYEKKGLTYINSSVVNLKGEALYEEEKIAELIDLNLFDNIIKSALSNFPTLNVISFGHHGIELNGEIIVSDYKVLEGISFSQYFSELYKIPVILENNVYSAVLNFSKRREVKNETLVYLHFPDNNKPSAGILIQGKIFKGKSNSAGEISQMPLGIDWSSDLYNNGEELIKAITKLIIAISATINPDTFIINGKSLNNDIVAILIKNSKELLPNNMVSKIYLSENFMSDYRNGLIIRAFEQLDPKIFLTEKK